MAGVSRLTFQVVVEAPNGDTREWTIGANPLVIGRDESADIRVDGQKVSRRHASLAVVDGAIRIEDLSSRNGIRINGEVVKGPRFLGPDDELSVGGYLVYLPGAAGKRQGGDKTFESAAHSPEGTSPASNKEYPGTPYLLGTKPPVKGLRHVLVDGVHVVGRAETCELSIADGSISREHARITVERKRVSLRDLGSFNGTFVNEEAVSVSTVLRHRDEVRFGDARFDVFVPKQLASRPPETPILKRLSGSMPVKVIAVVLSLFVVLPAIVYLRKGPEERKRLLGLFGSRGKNVKTATVSGARKKDPRKSPSSKASAMARTSTSPYSRRDADGLPLNLPEVDVKFDFDGFVDKQLNRAQGCRKRRDFACVLDATRALLNRDPISKEAKAFLDEAAIYQATLRLQSRARSFVEEGEYGEAFKLLLSVDERAPQVEELKTLAQKLQNQALSAELLQAKKDLKAKAYTSAYARLSFVLQFDPSSSEAAKAILEAERKMQARGMPILDRSSTLQKVSRAHTSEGFVPALKKKYRGQAGLLRVARLYARGSLPKAIRRAGELERRGKTKAKAKALKDTLRRIHRKYERIRIEISNDPSQAWVMLLDLKKEEARILPAGMSSFTVRELEAGLAQAFAERGSSLFNQQKYEDAFQQWEAGAKLDPTNSRVLAGLKQLEAEATKEAHETEIAGQRGARGVCARWKRITRITKAHSDVHQEALRQIVRVCR